MRKLTQGIGDEATDHGVFSKIAHFVHDRPWPIFIVLGALLVIIALLIGNLHLRSSYENYIPEKSDDGQAITLLSEQYPEFATPDITVLAEIPVDQVATVSSQQSWRKHISMRH